MDEDLRASIEAAMEDTPNEAPVVDTEVDTSAPQVDEPPAGEPDSGSVRDSLGRFVPKAKAGEQAQEAPQPPEGGLPPAEGLPTQPAPASQAPAVPPPVGWSPGVRAEHWASLPAAVQQEVARREQAFDHAFRQTAPAREAGEQFMRAVQPFMPAIQAEGVDPITAVTNLMQFGARMRMGTPAEKAATVAQIVKAYGVDIRQLDDSLAGVVPQPGQQQGVDPGYVQQAVQQALAPLMQAAQQRQQMQTQQVQQATATELQTFAADPKNEFFADLRMDMADIIELAERQGRPMPLAEAYQRAAMLHPEVSRVMIARQRGVSANALTAAARSAKAAAVSVKGSAPVGNPNGPEPSSIRESIEAAIESHSRV